MFGIRIEDIKIKKLIDICYIRDINICEIKENNNMLVIEIIRNMIRNYVKETNEYPKCIYIEPSLACYSLLNIKDDSLFMSIPIKLGESHIFNYIGLGI